MRSRLSDIAAAFLLAVAVTHPAGAADPAPPAESPETVQAREEFVRGTDFVHKAQWAEALAAFEQSARLKSHAVTTYNVGACQRALGRYTLARKTLQRALSENAAASGAQLPEGLVTDINGYLAQIESLLAVARVDLEPASAALAVDGRPLEADASRPGTLVAGIREPGPGETPPSGKFEMVVDPGAHVITLSRKGYADAVVNKTFAPGQMVLLPFALDRLPATMHIASDQPGAVVTVNGADVGLAPVEVSRPGGSYRVVVSKSGFITYEAQVNAQAGEDLSLSAKLPEEKKSLTQKWWFWTAAGAVVVSAGVGTYLLTRSEPAPPQPPLQCGGLGWCVQAK